MLKSEIEPKKEPIVIILCFDMPPFSSTRKAESVFFTFGNSSDAFFM